MSRRRGGAANEQAGITGTHCMVMGGCALAEILVTGRSRSSGNYCACTSEKVQAAAVVPPVRLLRRERVECGAKRRRFGFETANEKAFTVSATLPADRF